MHLGVSKCAIKYRVKWNILEKYICPSFWSDVYSRGSNGDRDDMDTTSQWSSQRGNHAVHAFVNALLPEKTRCLTYRRRNCPHEADMSGEACLNNDVLSRRQDVVHVGQRDHTPIADSTAFHTDLRRTASPLRPVISSSRCHHNHCLEKDRYLRSSSTNLSRGTS